MLELLLTLFAPVAFAAYEVPAAPEAYVLDQAEILSVETEQTLNAQLQTLDDETSTQMVVVTLADLQDYPIEEAALEIGRGWGVGQEDFNNGVVFLIAPNSQTARIEVGYGLEGAITDAQSNAILNAAAAFFVEANYDAGVQEAMGHLEGLARGEEFALEEVHLEENSWLEQMALFLLLGLGMGWVLLSWLSDTKAWWIGGVVGGLAGLIIQFTAIAVGVGALIGLVVDFILSKYFYKKIKVPKSKNRRRKGGPGSGTGSDSGFGGFGGGSFGGGGATKRW